MAEHKSIGDQASTLLEIITTGTTSSIARFEPIDYLLDLNKWNINNNGEDSTSTTNGINNALQWASDSGYNKVVFPQGTYLINAVGSDPANPTDGGIIPPNNITLDLTQGATLKVSPNSSWGYSCIYIKGKENVTIVGGTILCDRNQHDFSPTIKPSHEFGHGIYIRGSKRVRINAVTIKGATGDGIIISPTGLLNYPGSTYTPSENVIIESCTLDSSRRNNLSITGCDFAIVQNCKILNAGINDGYHDGTLPRFGIDIEGYGEETVDYETPLNVIIKNNQFIGNVNSSVSNFNGYGVVIEGNFADNNISYGYSMETTISNNILKTNNGTNKIGITSIGVSQGKERNSITIIGNVIIGFSSGIDIRGKEITVIGNTIRNFTNSGISTWEAEDVLIAGNSIRFGESANGVSLNRLTDGHIIGNEITNVNRAVWAPSQCISITVKNNVIMECSQALYTGNKCSVIFEANTVQTKASPITYVICYEGSDIAIINNTIKNASHFGIYGKGTTKIIGNVFDALNIYIGFLITGGSAFITRNTLLFTRSTSGIPTTGISLSGCDQAVIADNIIQQVSGPESTVTAINTSKSTNSKILTNMCLGSIITNHLTDVLNGNITDV
ncbi:hypothetical protein SOV_07480 [Sporomusa ovata DSM 2662]|uniref:Right handed beta helix domain-containing protein n=1 Tax=Sporomusa ovata TaxID=2378 RepID=A0A0U1L4W8_9FIRM|nr:right-handed parallel beta-helix repeat-containing protein [Sporomusa ovata]EQB28402.1 hypothetical protein SOV_1c00860 [Sporomusa ovata DSM 2662]CQR74726.1 FIG01230034: hypothetical protein [Sporomusa ovata]